MCWLLTFSKYISVPIITEWLGEESILKLEVSISNQKTRKSLRELLSEYSKLLCDNLFHASNEMSFIHACTLVNRWNLRPSELKCRIILGSFDLITIRKFKLSTIAATLAPLVGSVSMNVMGDQEEYLVKIVSLMKNVALLDATMTTSMVFKACAINCTFLTTVKLEACEKDMHNPIKLMCRMCPALTTLELLNLNDWKVIVSVVVHCRNLEHFMVSLAMDMMSRAELRICYYFPFHVSGKLRVLDDDNPFYGVLKIFPLVMWYRGRQLTTLQLIPERILQVPAPLGELCPRLETISFNSNTSYASNVAYHNTIASTVRATPSLKSVRLLKITNPTDETLLSLAASCSTQLREFHLDGRTPFPFSLTGVQMLCAQCTRISTLVLMNLILSDEMVVSIVSLCPQLREFMLLGCTDVTDSCLQILAPHIGNLLKFTFQCDVEVTAAGLDAVVDHCSSLTQLTLSHCDYIDVTSCAALIRAKALRLLNISEMTVHRPEPSYSGPGVSLLGASITTLIMCNVHLTDHSLLWLIPQCPRLEVLDLSTNRSLTSSAMVEVMPYLRKLQKLNLNFCGQVDDSVADAICEYCKRLENLSIFSTAISNYAIEEMERMCETILIFNHDGCL